MQGLQIVINQFSLELLHFMSLKISLEEETSNAFLEQDSIVVVGRQSLFLLTEKLLAETWFFFGMLKTSCALSAFIILTLFFLL